MTHPWTLHAATALWSLRRSWAALRDQAAAARLEAPDGLHGTTYGSRHSSGGHSDGVSDLIAAPPSWERWALVDEQIGEHVTQACWLIRSATRLPRDGRQLLDYLAAGIPLADPGTARDVAGYLQAADRTARRALAMPPDRVPLPGVACPGCITRRLEVHTAAPERAHWTVVCAAGCVCHGRLCPCTTAPGTTPADGVPHIWPWTVVVAAAKRERAA